MQIAGEPLGRVIDRFGVKVGPPTIYARCPVSPQADMAVECAPGAGHLPDRRAFPLKRCAALLPQKGPQVLRADLNCSESEPRAVQVLVAG
jgi:hypothetical protein